MRIKRQGKRKGKRTATSVSLQGV